MRAFDAITTALVPTADGRRASPDAALPIPLPPPPLAASTASTTKSSSTAASTSASTFAAAKANAFAAAAAKTAAKAAAAAANSAGARAAWALTGNIAAWQPASAPTPQPLAPLTAPEVARCAALIRQYWPPAVRTAAAATVSAGGASGAGAGGAGGAKGAGGGAGAARLALLTYATDVPPHWLLGRSAALHGVPLVLAGLGRRWAGVGVKAPAVRRAVQLLSAALGERYATQGSNPRLADPRQVCYSLI